MNKIALIEGTKTYPDALGIAKERHDEIDVQLGKIMEGFNCKYDTAILFEKFLHVAETEYELVYCAFQAGRKIEELEQDDKRNSVQIELLKALAKFVK